MTNRPKSARGDWAKQLRWDMQFAERTLVKQGSINAMYVVHTKNAIHAIATPWRDDDEKAGYLDMVRVYAIAKEAIAVAYIGEAWVRHVVQASSESQAEFNARVDAVRPRDAEDRREVVSIHIAYYDDAGERQIISDTKEIDRRGDGKPVGLKPYRDDYQGWDIVAGAVVEVLPDQAPSMAERIAAQAILKAAGMSGGET
jgi:hypothetical protein